MADHGLIDPESPLGVRVADALCLDAIEDALGLVGVYSDLARTHAQMNDLRGLEYDLKIAKAHFQIALDAYRDIEARHAAAKREVAA